MHYHSIRCHFKKLRKQKQIWKAFLLKWALIKASNGSRHTAQHWKSASVNMITSSLFALCRYANAVRRKLIIKWCDANRIAILLHSFPLPWVFFKKDLFCMMKHWSLSGIKHAYTLTHLSHFIWLNMQRKVRTSTPFFMNSYPSCAEEWL